MKIEEYIQLSGPLFEAVQTEAIFSDPKTFVDSLPKKEPEEILTLYRKEKEAPSFDLKKFIEKNFELDISPSTLATKDQPMEEYIYHTWDTLFREMIPNSPYSTLIALPKEHAVPGGRFRECFYWDSYFVALGLAIDKQISRIIDMVENFASLIDRFGLIPNGNRVYFLSRSQPPYLSLLLTLLMELGEDEFALNHFSTLEKEYAYWMQTPSLSEDKKAKSALLVEGKGTLNRYFDEKNIPRPEAYLREKNLGKNIQISNFYRGLRAICASGWDFSSRWFTEAPRFDSIAILDLLPVDLNSLLYQTEHTLAEFATKLGKNKKAALYRQASLERKKIIQNLFWSEKKQFFFDYHLPNHSLTSNWSLAAITPLFLKIATKQQAKAVRNHLEEKFLFPGGLVTTLYETGHQWDYPNGWAPLQWMAVQGLCHYGYTPLAREIATRWLALNKDQYKKTGTLLEKYNVCNCSLSVAKGEYTLQQGFGWTNGVALALIDFLSS